MIYTVTFNPSLDYVVSIDDFKAGSLNRTRSEMIFPGGKGINVSIVLSNLGVENTALGFLAGFTGLQIENLLKERGITTDFILIENGMSRINVKLRSKEETEINGMGPYISAEYIEELLQKLGKLRDGDVLILAGSVPESMPSDIYGTIMDNLRGKSIKVIVDATKDLLLNVLEYEPFLIKPNVHELGDIFGKVLSTQEEIVGCAKQLQEKGAQNVLVSMGGDGAILVTCHGEVLVVKAPVGTVVNSVGAGDSMVAGFITKYLNTQDYNKALLYGVCAGSASAFSEELANKEDVEKFIDKIKVNE